MRILSFFNNLKIINKFIVVLLIFGVIIGIFAFAFAMPKFYEIMLLERQQGLKNNLDISFELVDFYHSKFSKGELTEQSAKEALLKALNSLKYDNGMSSFWIIDLNGKMILNPMNPEQIGKDISEIKSTEGELVYKDIINVSKNQNEFYSENLEYNSIEKSISKKISISKLYQSWGWIIGTGVYENSMTKDLKEKLFNIQLFFFIFVAIVSIILIVIVYLFAKNLSNDINKVAEIANKLSNGDFSSFK
jgi:methyl-accepting chemotaxis protein